ncbi:MAG: hypothetical protein L3K09_03205 [Thermoplasmata archaeon]|nr:hypothetical protein [Thermoplasmata archaeon]
MTTLRRYNTHSEVARHRSLAWGGPVFASVLVASLLIVSPLGSGAGSAKPPYFGAMRTNSLLQVDGCATSKILKAPAFSFKTGRGNLSVSSNLRKCNPGLGYGTYNLSYTTGGMVIDINLTHTLGLGGKQSFATFTNFSVGVSLSARTLAQVVTTTMCPPGPVVEYISPTNASYDENTSMADCGATAQAFEILTAFVVDETNDTSWAVNGSTLPPSCSFLSVFCSENLSEYYNYESGTEFGPGNAYGYTPNVWGWTNLSSWSNYSYPSATGYTGSFWFNSTDGHSMCAPHNTCGFLVAPPYLNGWKFNSHHIYALLLYVNATVEAYGSGFAGTRASATVSDPSGFTITSVRQS